MRILLASTAGALALASLSVSAADHEVLARNGPGSRNFFPATLTIQAGDTVTFKNDPAGPGFHNVVSDDGAITSFRCASGCDGVGGGNGDPASGLWSATVTFPTAGTVGYYCEVHGSSGGGGMSGSITIEPAAAPIAGVDQTSLSASAAAGATATAAFSVSNSGTATLDWGVGTAETDCATPGTVPWLTLSPSGGEIAAGAAPAPVDVTLDAATLAVGVYSAQVCVRSNDPAHNPIALPVEFTVTASDTIFEDGFDLVLP